jgi:DNA-nicking Smr family endonuclease
MTRRKEPRRLSAEDRALWDRVAETAQPLHPAQKDAPAPVPAPRPKAGPGPGAAGGDERGAAKSSTAIPSFRLGEAAEGGPARHDLLAPVADRIAARAPRMDKRTHGRLRRGKLAPEARIDLHGMTLARAHPTLAGFILRAHAEGKRLVLVITGKGRGGEGDGPIPERRGALRHQVPAWLDSPPLSSVVLDVVQAHASHGGGGAYYVYLRRRR